MTKLTDETLMYYADGLLSPSECEWVERQLASDLELRSRLEIFRSTGRSLSKLLEEEDDAPPPRKLLDFVANLQPAPASAKTPSAGGKPASDGRRGAARSRETHPSFGQDSVSSNARLASAAVMALVVGAALGWMARGSLTGAFNAATDLVRVQGDQLIAKRPLQDALDAVASGARTKLTLANGSELRLTMKMTFRNDARNYCREYELSGGASERYIAVACRIDGVWAVQFQALSPPLPGGKAFLTPAGGQSPAINAAVSALIDGERLSWEDEAALLGKSWKE